MTPMAASTMPPIARGRISLTMPITVSTPPTVMAAMLMRVELTIERKPIGILLSAGIK